MRAPHLHNQQDVFIFYIKKSWKVVHPSSETTTRRVAYKNVFHPSLLQSPTLVRFVKSAHDKDRVGKNQEQVKSWRVFIKRYKMLHETQKKYKVGYFEGWSTILSQTAAAFKRAQLSQMEYKNRNFLINSKYLAEDISNLRLQDLKILYNIMLQDSPWNLFHGFIEPKCASPRYQNRPTHAILRHFNLFGILIHLIIP